MKLSLDVLSAVIPTLLIYKSLPEKNENTKYV